MPEFYFDSAAESLSPLVEHLWFHGESVAPRGIETKEVPHLTIIIGHPNDCLMMGINRKWNHKLAALEALQLIAGRQYPQLMAAVAPSTARFLDGEAFHGAYGPRLRQQIPKIMDTLRMDMNSRQAIATIWDPAYDGFADTADTPCTVYLSFMIRDGKLIMHTHMRSNDVWWGWCYDVTQFCSLQVHMATAMGLEVGPYVHYADSFHMYYERDFDAVKELTDPADGHRDLLVPISLGAWQHQVDKARALLDGKIEWAQDSWLQHQAWRIHRG